MNAIRLCHRCKTTLALLTVFLLILVATACDEFMPSRTVVTPVLTERVDLDANDVLSRTFSLKDSGRYSVYVELTLRQRLNAMAAEPQKFRLAGVAQIVDEGHGFSLERNCGLDLIDNEVRVTLFEFHSDDVGGKGEKLLRFTVDVDSRFREHYSEMWISIRRKMRFPILD